MQSCVLDHLLRSSLCKVLCFRKLFWGKKAEVIVPSRENARLTIGEDGTLLGLNISEPVSHRNRKSALKGLGAKRNEGWHLKKKQSEFSSWFNSNFYLMQNNVVVTCFLWLIQIVVDKIFNNSKTIKAGDIVLAEKSLRDRSKQTCQKVPCDIVKRAKSVDCI